MDCGVCQNGESETNSVQKTEVVNLCLTSYYQKCFITVSLTSHLQCKDTLHPRVVIVSMNFADVS